MRAILYVFNGLVALGFIETGPAAMGVKLGVRFKQKSITASTVIAARSFLLQKLPGPGPFGASKPQNLVFKVSQLLFPLLICLIDLIFHGFCLLPIYNRSVTNFAPARIPNRVGHVEQDLG
jgi:hypothetical protein